MLGWRLPWQAEGEEPLENGHAFKVWMDVWRNALRCCKTVPQDSRPRRAGSAPASLCPVLLRLCSPCWAAASAAWWLC